MKKLIFLDTETTGLSLEDRLCQVAYKIGDKTVNEFYKPEIPISVGAMSVSHITNEMVDDKPVFIGSKEHEELYKLSLDEDVILVAHNATFDIGMLSREGIEFKNFICTERVARYFDEEGDIDRFSLQYLRYLLALNIDAQAHDALGDIMVLEALFDRLLKSMSDKYKFPITEYDKLVEVSSTPSLIKKFPFGKYIGEKVGDILIRDKGYLEWLYRQKCDDEIINEEWIHTLKHHLNLT